MRQILVLVLAGLSLVACGGGDGGGSQSPCRQIGTAICQKACSCREGPTCATAQGALTLDFDSEADCRGFLVTFGCSQGDMAAYNDATACLPLVQAAMCASTGPEGALAFPPDLACQTPP